MSALVSGVSREPVKPLEALCCGGCCSKTTMIVVALAVAALVPTALFLWTLPFSTAIAYASTWITMLSGGYTLYTNSPIGSQAGTVFAPSHEPSAALAAERTSIIQVARNVAFGSRPG